MKKIGIHAVLIASLVSLAGCGKKPADTGAKGDPPSPQVGAEARAAAETRAVAEKFMAAMSKKDWATALSCMDEESQTVYVMHTMGFASFLSVITDDSTKSKTSLGELLKRHLPKKEPAKGEVAKKTESEPVVMVTPFVRGGPKMVATMTEALKGIDKAALVGDLATWSEKNQPPAEGTTKNGITFKRGGRGDSPFEGIDKSDFSEFKIDGDAATATTTLVGGTWKTICFKRVGEKWCVDFVTTMRKGMENMQKEMENMKRPPTKKGP